jgi:hypothetical protein
MINKNNISLMGAFGLISFIYYYSAKIGKEIYDAKIYKK